QIQEQVRNLAKELGLHITNRYSPGYCSWNVEEQQKLFSLFPKGTCGISLSESSLMSPVKSISGIIGIGAEVKYREYTCEICPMLNCQFRKVGNQ
ncbi:MAG: methionine synthase, partial [Bacteroidales bacterium]|nr:methionine synthase [Bacteroidales bacterium]